MTGFGLSCDRFGLNHDRFGLRCDSSGLSCDSSGFSRDSTEGGRRRGTMVPDEKVNSLWRSMEISYVNKKKII